MSDNGNGHKNGNGNGEPSLHNRSEGYFIPFEYINPIGHKYLACGARKRNCGGCGYRFPPGQKLVKSCPVCGMDRRCTKAPQGGSRRCKFHGKPQARGKLHPNYKTGKHAMPVSFPADVQKAYFNSLKTMDARNVFGEMAIFATRIDQLSSRIGTRSESDQWWTKLGKLVTEVNDCISEGDDDGAERCLKRMMKLASKGSTEAQQWREITRLCKDLANLKKVQANIERDNKSFLSADDARTIIHAMANAVREAMSLVQTHWREVEAGLHEDELAVVLETGRQSGNIEITVEQWHQRLPRARMRGCFRRADRVIQKQLHDLLPDTRNAVHR